MVSSPSFNAKTDKAGIVGFANSQVTLPRGIENSLVQMCVVIKIFTWQTKKVKKLTSFHSKLTALSNDINISHFYKLQKKFAKIWSNAKSIYSLGVLSRFCLFCYMLKTLNALYQQTYNLELNRWCKQTWSSMYSYPDKSVYFKAYQGLAHVNSSILRTSSIGVPY